VDARDERGHDGIGELAYRAGLGAMERLHPDYISTIPDIWMN
jgi:hypothetical protein